MFIAFCSSLSLILLLFVRLLFYHVFTKNCMFLLLKTLLCTVHLFTCVVSALAKPKFILGYLEFWGLFIYLLYVHVYHLK